MKSFIVLLLGLSLCQTNLILAQTGAPIRIHAGSIKVDQKSGSIIYRNKVRLRQGNMTILADKITSKTSGGKIRHIIATGSPVLVRHAADVDFQTTTLQAKRLEYTVTERSLVMSGEVKVLQGPDTLLCDHIKYLMPSRSLSATADTGHRIHASFVPQNNTSPTQPMDGSAP